MSDALLVLVLRRQELRDAVLTAIMAPDGAAQTGAWQDVDKAAVTLARERRRYDRYIKDVLANGRNAQAPQP